MSKFFQRRDLDKTFFKVLVSMLMVFVLLISVASPSHAVVGVTSILIPSVITALESWGISTAADGLDGDQIAEWFHDKLTSWETAAQISLANIVTGIKMTPIGQVLLNPIALAGIREFAAWFVQQNGLSDDGSYIVSSASVTYHGYDMATAGEWSSTRTGFSARWVCGPGTYCFVKLNRATLGYYSTVYFCSDYSTGSLTADIYHNGVLDHTTTYTVDHQQGSVWYGSFVMEAISSSTLPSASFSISDVVASTDTSIQSSGSLTIETGTISVPTTADIQDKEMLINTSLDVGADAAAWYEQVMNKVAANDMTATGTIVGAGTITADQVIDQGAITEQEGVVSWPDVTVPIGVSGLDEIFPFCIPFDIYHFFEALAADPVAPSFEIPFVIEGVVDYTFEIDLEPFDQVAQVLRLLELLAFCVGLAFVTRSMFIRG